MKTEIDCGKKSEKIVACVLIDESDEIAWCIYHPDDGQEKLVFTKNPNDFQYIENFENVKIEEIIKHLNSHGFEIEPKKEFDEVLEFKKLNNKISVKLVDAEIHSKISLKFTI